MKIGYSFTVAFILLLIEIPSSGQTVLTLQPSGAAGVDATISNFPGEATTNYGTNQEFMSESKSINFTPYAKRGLIKFDLSSIPANATVISAYLSTYAYNLPGTGGHLSANNNMGYLFRVTQSWNEGTVTWSTQPPYTTADTVFFPISDSSNQNYLNVDVRNQVQMQVANAATNYGFLFKQKYECTCNGRLVFGSSDNATASLRPKLVVTYAVCSGAPPSATLTPSGSPTICYGNSQVLTANAGAGYVYQWYRNGAFIIGGSSNTFSATTSGAYTVKVTNPQGCTAMSAATNLVVSLENAKITTAAGSTTQGCANGGLTINATASGVGNSFQWRLNGNPFGAPNAASYTSSNTGNYSCYITNSTITCSYLTNTINSQVQVANMTTSGSNYFCNNNSYDMMVQSLNIGGNATYQWTNNGVNIAGANSFAYSATTTGNYQCIIDDQICVANTLSPVYPVTAGVPPQIEIYSPAGPSPVNLCGGQAMDMWIRDAITHEDWILGGAQWYKDGVALPWNGGIPALTLVSNGGVYTCDLTTSCGVSFSPYPGMVVHSANSGTPPPLINPTGSVNACGSVSFTTPSSQYAPWVSYQWQKNGVNISGATSDFYNATTSGSYRCIFGNGCGTITSVTTTITITTAVPATPGSITTTGGAVKVCPGETRTYSIAAVTGAISYTWTPCAGSTITSGQNTTSVTILYNANFPASDTIRVVANNFCGHSAQRKLKISRNTPGTPAAITGDNFGACNLSGRPFSVTNVSGITYNWSFNTGTATVASGQGTSAITANFGAGFISGPLSVTASNGCGASAARTKTIYAKPATPVSITGATSVCVNQQDVPYSIAPLANVTNYTWTGPTGSHISDGINTSVGATLITTAAAVTVDFATTAGSVKVRGNNSCASGSYKTLSVAIVCREGDFSNAIAETRIYPNPATSEFTLESDDTSAPLSLEIYDAYGRLVFSEVNVKSGYRVDANEWADGLYSVVVQNGNDKTTLKLAIQNPE